MHVDLAIEKLKERQELDKIRAKLKITKTQIAQEAGVTLPAVVAYFRGATDSVVVEKAAHKLLKKA